MRAVTPSAAVALLFLFVLPMACASDDGASASSESDDSATEPTDVAVDDPEEDVVADPEDTSGPIAIDDPDAIVVDVSDGDAAGPIAEFIPCEECTDEYACNEQPCSNNGEYCETYPYCEDNSTGWCECYKNSWNCGITVCTEWFGCNNASQPDCCSTTGKLAVADCFWGDWECPNGYGSKCEDLPCGSSKAPTLDGCLDCASVVDAIATETLDAASFLLDCESDEDCTTVVPDVSCAEPCPVALASKDELAFGFATKDLDYGYCFEFEKKCGQAAIPCPPSSEAVCDDGVCTLQ